MGISPFDAMGKALARQASRRRLLTKVGAAGLAASVTLSGLARSSAAQQVTPTPGPETAVPPALPPFVYRLEQSAPLNYAGGTLRTATVENIPGLKDMAIFSEVVNPGAVRELHWHPNAHELSYILSGEGTIGVMPPEGKLLAFPISTGSVSFAPAGYPHYIVNTGPEPLRLVLAFSHENPQRLDWSVALPMVPTSLVAETFGVSAAAVPLLSSRGDVSIVPATGKLPQPSMSDAAKPFTINVSQVKPNTYIGGTTRPVVGNNLSSLQGLSLFPLTAQPFGLREPHWHANASELNYCVSGHAQIGMVAPNGGTQTVVVGPGDVCYIPVNWFHYIANITEDPLDFLVFFSNPNPDHIDLSQLTAAFPAELLAASFDIDPAVIAHLPNRGDVFIAKAQTKGQATPAAS